MNLSKLVYKEGTRYFLYNYSNNLYRFCVVKNYRKPTYDTKIDYNSDENKRIAKSRAIKNIKEYALCNDFQYFITLTVSSSSCDRFSLDDCQTKLKKMFKAYKRKNKDFAYIIITEKHKNGAFHFHGLVKNCGNDIYENKNGYLSCSFFDALGFNSFSFIRDKVKCANYITKYITKNPIQSSDSHYYYFNSRGLKKADKVELNLSSIPATLQSAPGWFENDFVKIIDFDLTKFSNFDMLELMETFTNGEKSKFCAMLNK